MDEVNAIQKENEERQYLEAALENKSNIDALNADVRTICHQVAKYNAGHFGESAMTALMSIKNSATILKEDAEQMINKIKNK